MSTTSPSDIKTDLELLCESLALRRPLDPTVVKRVQDRAEQVCEKLREQGTMNVVTELLREARDE